VASASKAKLCVQVVRAQASSQRGDAATWTVSAWMAGGNVPDATIRLQATPSSAIPGFSFGCGSFDGTSSCDLGAMDAKSAPRQLQAQVTVPASATSVTSVSLTVIGSAAHLPKDPKATAAITITDPPTPITVTSPLPVGSLPGIAGVTPAPSPSLSPGGNAAGLFPTIDPSPSPGVSQKESARAVANTTALPESAPVVGAQLVGLAALGLAFVLAVTRMSIRRRNPAGQPTAGTPAAQDAKDAPDALAPGKPADPKPADPNPGTDEK
jgi:hypothetical protein